ncbi:MAG: hypothetical protein RQ847_03395 [Wenzhouxiangellaceae bacterium]|nr:hypothetical protein [Wenzhouxiangellaceae bacterium]
MVIEFVIVVAGIFVGLQVTEWNEQRQLRERETYVITQLASDIRAIEEQAKDYAELYRGKVASADRIMAFIASGLESPEDEAVLLDDFSNVMFRRPPIGRPPAFVELVSAGDTGIIRNDQLREAMTRFDLGMQAALRSDEVVIDFWFRYGESLGRKIILNDRLGENFGDVQYSVGDYDLAAMRGDPEFLSSLSWIKRMHVISADMNGIIVVRSSEMAERLEAAKP